MKNVMDVVFILDKSGSMASMVSDAVGGFNSLIKKTKELDADIRITTVLFNDVTDMLYERVPINEVKEMTKDDYWACGCTALLDAIGEAIEYIDDAKAEEGKTVFYITTDGMENSSREYNYKMITKMIKMHEKLGYEFNFLASGIDCEAVGSSMGIRRERCRPVPSGRKGQEVLFETVCCSIKEAVENE